jgi:hypothetical protein
VHTSALRHRFHYGPYRCCGKPKSREVDMSRASCLGDKRVDERHDKIKSQNERQIPEVGVHGIVHAGQNVISELSNAHALAMKEIGPDCVNDAPNEKRDCHPYQATPKELAVI